MELSHTFTVPAGVEETWAHFADIASVATCFPGAQVTEATEESFTGTVKVKLGPIALVYAGNGTFVERDEAAKRMLIDAKGRDKRGNGTAGAKVTMTMSANGETETEVQVLTDLNITGKPAQFGRGVIQDVSDKLLGQFTSCLAQRLAADGSAADVPAADAATTAGPAGAAVGNAENAAAEVAAAQAAEPASATPAAAPRPAAPAPAEPEALDLGATVVPVLLKAYWKQLAALGVVVALLIWWFSRD